MRMTLSIDDDVLEAARGIADRTDRSLGDVVSELARLGLRSFPSSTRHDLPVFEVSEKARTFGSAAVRRALNDGV